MGPSASPNYIHWVTETASNLKKVLNSLPYSLGKKEVSSKLLSSFLNDGKYIFGLPIYRCVQVGVVFTLCKGPISHLYSVVTLQNRLFCHVDDHDGCIQYPKVAWPSSTEKNIPLTKGPKNLGSLHGSNGASIRAEIRLKIELIASRLSRSLKVIFQLFRLNCQLLAIKTQCNSNSTDRICCLPRSSSTSRLQSSSSPFICK